MIKWHPFFTSAKENSFFSVSIDTSLLGNSEALQCLHFKLHFPVISI